jgi:hypothetical protein
MLRLVPAHAPNSPMDTASDYVHFDQRNPANSLFRLSNRGLVAHDPPRCERFVGQKPGSTFADRALRSANISWPVPLATKGVEMRFFAVLVAICALSQTAIAQTPECKSMADAGQRLACYDKSAPPPASPAAAKQPSRPAPAAKVDAAKYVDRIGAEDALMNARLKNICRGC